MYIWCKAHCACVYIQLRGTSTSITYGRYTMHCYMSLVWHSKLPITFSIGSTTLSLNSLEISICSSGSVTEERSGKKTEAHCFYITVSVKDLPVSLCRYTWAARVASFLSCSAWLAISLLARLEVITNIASLQWMVRPCPSVRRPCNLTHYSMYAQSLT